MFIAEHFAISFPPVREVPKIIDFQAHFAGRVVSEPEPRDFPVSKKEWSVMVGGLS